MPFQPEALWEATGGELALRLKAWWYGFDRRTHVPPPAPPPAPAPELVEEGPLDRLVLAQRLWGGGFLIPGGADQVMSLVKPFGVNPAMSLLDLTAGLGGPSRHVSNTFDVYITGFERVAETAQRGNQASVDSGLGRKVPISAYDPEKLELRAHAFDGVYAQFLTGTISDKERLMRMVMRSLKPRGQFSFIDFVLQNGDAGDPRLETLRQRERDPLLLWTVPQYRECLSNAGFDCRITQDETASYKRQVVQGWAQFLRNQKITAMPRHHLRVVLEEAELWMGRLQALEEGTLSVCRFYAVSTQSRVG